MKREEMMLGKFHECFQYEGILLVPDYLEVNLFVQPGHTLKTPKKKYSAHQLLKAGATRVTEYLWARP